MKEGIKKNDVEHKWAKEVVLLTQKLKGLFFKKNYNGLIKEIVASYKNH